MAYEIINNGQITPMRLHALLRLVLNFPELDEKQILELLQPRDLYENTNAADAVLDAAVKCGLISSYQDDKYSLKVDEKYINSIEEYRKLLQNVLLGVLNEENNNYLLNIFVSWYASLNEKVLTYDNLEFIAADFNRSLFPNAPGRSLNDTKLRGMDDWLVFLGFGWKIDRSSYFLLPDATGRIQPIISELVTSDEWMPMGPFMQNLGKQCPELDTGVLFERCWSAVYGQRDRGNQLSLMVSTALRTMQSIGIIQLNRVADARDQWKLYDDISSEYSTITHIRMG